MPQTSFSSELVRSCADLVILKLLASRPMHGYDILMSMGDTGDGRFRFKQGTLYPVLYRLEREGWITAQWQAPSSGRKRKVYSVTKEGRRVCQQRTREWRLFTASIDAILKEGADD